MPATRLDDDDLFGDVRATEVPARFSSSAEGSRVLPAATSAPALEEMDWDEENRQDPLIVELIRTWTNERLAPDILDQRGELLQKILDRIREQVCVCVSLSPFFSSAHLLRQN